MGVTIVSPDEIEYKVAAGIVLRGSKVLIVQRTLKEGILNWQFPAGKMKSSESSINAAIREVYEETGIRCRFVENIGSRRHPKTKVRMFYIICEYVSGRKTVKNTNEVRRVEWVGCKDLKAYMPEDLLYPKLLEYLEENY